MKQPDAENRNAGARAAVELGEDPEREGLRKTPQRVAKALTFLTNGYRADLEQVINNALFTQDTSSMVIVKDIEIYSMCEHHMLPFFGRCHIGYIPNGKVFGVSKLARLVDMFARRLQLQERLTEQISQAIMEEIDAKGVGVMIEARHLCMMMRGVEKQNSTMVTSSVLGVFRDHLATREEFLTLVGRNDGMRAAAGPRACCRRYRRAPSFARNGSSASAPTGFTFPDYRGSDEGRGYVLPFPYVIYRGDILRVDRQGVRGVFFESDRVEFDFSLTARRRSTARRTGRAKACRSRPHPRDRSAPERRPGARREPRPRAQLSPAGARGDCHRPVVRAGPGRDRFSEPDLRFAPALSRGALAARPAGRAALATHQYHRYFYSVEEQFATPERPRTARPADYRARRWRLRSIDASRNLVGAFTRYESLKGAAFEASPLSPRLRVHRGHRVRLCIRGVEEQSRSRRRRLSR